MSLDFKKVLAAIGAVVALIAIVVVVLSLKPGSTGTTGQGGTLGTSSTVAGGTTGSLSVPLSQQGTTSLPAFGASGATVGTPIFKISDGPVIAATLMESGTPTTTTARFLLAGSGHVMELPLDVPGAVARAVSNTTIPGIEHALWTEGGNGVLVQYENSGTVKTAHLSLGSTPGASSIQFFPDGITAVTISGDGRSVLYALPRQGGGSSLYKAAANGSGSALVAVSPLNQIELLWPSKNSALFYTDSAVGVGGLVFSLDIASGQTVPILSGQGITATADPSFSFIIHRIDTENGAALFSENTKSGAVTSISLAASSLQPALPETCAWGGTTSSAYCSAPEGSAPYRYLDLWHRGEASVASALVRIDPRLGVSYPVATPGTRDGGVVSDIIGISVAPQGNYLSFISKDDGSLWGVRLSK